MERATGHGVRKEGGEAGRKGAERGGGRVAFSKTWKNVVVAVVVVVGAALVAVVLLLSGSAPAVLRVGYREGSD